MASGGEHASAITGLVDWDSVGGTIRDVLSFTRLQPDLCVGVYV